MSGAPANGSTFVACLTPPGAAAIATLALYGPQAWSVLRQVFRPLNPRQVTIPEVPQCGPLLLGRLSDTDQPGLADQVVAAVNRVTPIPSIEVHCHGGPEMVRWLLEIFQRHGLTLCTWQELERKRIADPLRASAMEALANASTLRTAGILLDQFDGAFGSAISSIRAALDAGDCPQAHALLKDLECYANVGKHLSTGWHVAIIGAVNAGKSSLINALAGYQRSVVAETPGTTRDLVTVRLALDGWPVELLDTAGFRAGAGLLEQQGMELTQAAARKADLSLWLLDASAEPVWPDFSLDSIRFVVNKVDLPPAWDLAGAPGAIAVSAHTGSGLANLYQALSEWLVPQVPPEGTAVPFTPGLCTKVQEALASCRAGNVIEASMLVESLAKE